MDATCFDIERDGHVAHLRLNRPDAYNSMIREFWSELPAAVRELDEGGDVRAIVISSTGKHFCAGMDLAVFTGGGGDLSGNGEGPSSGPAEQGRARAKVRQLVRLLQDSFSTLERARGGQRLRH